MNSPQLDSQLILDQLTQTIKSRLPSANGDANKSYVAQLFQKGPDAFLKKIGEEATELVMACKDQDKDKIVSEAADLMFHSMVALGYYDLDINQVLNELAKRQGISGLEEKASRS